MKNKKIQDDQEFLFYLEFNNIDYKDYDYTFHEQAVL